VLKNLAKTILFSLLLTLFVLPETLRAQNITTSHGVSLFGPLLYEPDFKHFAYVNPNAPRGGTIVRDIPPFDSINRYITLGTPPAFADLFIAETLMVESADEPNSAYGLIAETIRYPADYSWVEFTIRDVARWNDGRPLTVDDVIYSFELIRDHAAPSFQVFVSDVEKAERIGRNTVRFTFRSAGNRSNMYNIATQVPVFAKHYWETRDFSQPTTTISVQSTPYTVARVDVGNSIILRRDPNYWGRDLPVNIGRHNFDEIRMDVFRDANIAYEAFMAGRVDVREETTPTRWRTGYRTDAVTRGFIQRSENVVRGPLWFVGIGTNGRQPQFRDVQTREALTYAFDWEWTNRNIFHGMYERSNSYFANTELAHQGVPQGREFEFLEPFRSQLDPRVFTQPFSPPNTGGTQQGLRNNLRRATEMLEQAGWRSVNGRLMRDGRPFTINFMLQGPAD